MNAVKGNRRIKRRSVYGRRQLRHPKKKNTGLRLGFLIAAFLFAVAMKYSDRPPVSDIREFVSENLGSGEELKEAASVIGRALIGEEGLWGAINNAAVKVFGPRSDDIDENDDEAVISPENLPTISPNVFDEISPESTGDNLSSGAFAVQPLVFRKEISLDEINAVSYAKYGGGICETAFPEDAALLTSILFPENELAPETDSSVEKPQSEAAVLPFSFKTPFLGIITSPFGVRTDPFTGKASYHHGIDIGAKTGDAVKSFAAGTVSETGKNSIYGRYVRIDHGDSVTTFYAHLNKVCVKKGNTVTMGQKIAEAGNTGRSTGPHLHFEIRKNGIALNPLNYVRFS